MLFYIGGLVQTENTYIGLKLKKKLSTILYTHAIPKGA